MRDEFTISAALQSFTPLVRATAFRYQGRGADFDDLVQEGYLALITLIPKCPDKQWLAQYLKNNLPGFVRDAAARMRRWKAQDDGSAYEEAEDTAAAEEDGYSAAELRTMLERMLTPAELDLTQALMEGFTQKEIASLLHITQQAVAARLKKIRTKLKAV
ncbi:MAG: sigma-70 family RNA polymerase sigma factor, partial [Synergistes sp.]|nr:sigma-70 family RNA polymerase sigma factor [Synergistes sp.]